MNPEQLKTQILSALLAGTGRQPIAGIPGPNADLKALSLAGQALRFRRPASPPHFTVEPIIADDRTVLPDALRRSLLRLVTGKLTTEHAPLALAHAFDRLRLRPHPFDLPRMEHFVRTYAEQLGTTAQSWARPKDQVASDRDGYFDEEVLTDDNWVHAALARRADYLEMRRVQDGAAARALLEAAWALLNPDARLRLLQALAPTIHAADCPFLESLDKDRAPRVRAYAQRLLSRLGGSRENPALRELLQRIRQTQAGLLRRRTVLKLELPATVKEQAAPMWIRDSFSEIGFDELANALKLTEGGMIAAASEDGNLLLGLALMAIADRRLDLLEQIVSGHLPEAWSLLEQSGLRDLTLLTAAERLRWAEILIRPGLSTSYLRWSWLHRMLQRPASPQLIASVLKPGWLEALPDLERQGAVWMEVITSLCPSEQRGLLRTRLAAFAPSYTATALPLLDLLDAMENTRPHA